MKVLNEKCVKAVSGFVAAQSGADKKKTGMADILFAEGVTSAMCTAPKKGEDRTFFDSLKAAVVLGFTSQVQALLAKPTKALSNDKKIEKRDWQQRIGARVGDVKRALESREREGQEGEEEGTTSTWEDRTKKALTAMIDQVQKKEGVKIKDVPAFVKALKDAAARIL